MTAQASTKQTSASARRPLRILKLLKGHTTTGLSNIEIARATNDSASNVTRALQVLIDEGLVTPLENGRFAHSIQMLQIAQAHSEHIHQMQARMAEINQRIAAGAYRH